MLRNRNLWGLIIALVCCAGLYLLYQEYEYRSIYGRVTAVSLFNWDQEVKQVRDREPVLIYFRSPGDNDKQRLEVERVAWAGAHRLKVVEVECDPKARPENLVFMVRFAVVRCPAFIVLYKDKEIRGNEGAFADRHELERLVAEATRP
jgi:thioredoxin-like negative regulator of GroEL